jgi:hypothetical protein
MASANVITPRFTPTRDGRFQPYSVTKSKRCGSWSSRCLKCKMSGLFRHHITSVQGGPRSTSLPIPDSNAVRWHASFAALDLVTAKGVVFRIYSQGCDVGSGIPVVRLGGCGVRSRVKRRKRKLSAGAPAPDFRDWETAISRMIYRPTSSIREGGISWG